MSKSTLGNYNFLLHYFVPRPRTIYIPAARLSSLLSRCLLFILCCRKFSPKFSNSRELLGADKCLCFGLLNIWVALVVAADWKDQELLFKLQSLCAWEVKGPKKLQFQHFCLSSEMTVILAPAPPLFSVGIQTPSSSAYPLYSIFLCVHLVAGNSP